MDETREEREEIAAEWSWVDEESREQEEQVREARNWGWVELNGWLEP